MTSPEPQRRPLRAQERHEGGSDATTAESQKRHLLTQAHASRASGISDAVVIKDEGLYFLCNKDGCVPLADGHGLGLYFHDCRYLSAYELRICDVRPEPLAASAADGFRSIFQLTNPDIGAEERQLSRQKLGLRWRHVLDADSNTLRDEILLENYDIEPHDASITVTVDADFRDVFVIRGLLDVRPGRLRPARWRGGELVLSYEGGDDLLRELHVRFSSEPSWRKGKQVGFSRRLGSHESWRLVVSLAIVERDSRTSCPRVSASAAELKEAERTHAMVRSTDDWMKGFAEVRSESMWLDRTMDRSLRDLRALHMTLDDETYFAAGVPWFTTLFGRDSLICALQTLVYRRETAAETLRLLARYQGKRVDPWREEEPGRILHELRDGELARMGAIPYTPYFGTIDATPLFVILLGEYTRWAGSMELFEELSDPLDAALGWIGSRCNGDGYLAYDSTPGRHLVNQGWKDSGDAIVDAQGRTVEPPIALVEVQGYVFRAWLHAAELFEHAGDHERAETLRREAAALRARFNRDFWIEDRRFLALALQRDGRPVKTITSNPGHALWTGIVDAEFENAVVDRLLAEDMYSGWGIRTLAASEPAYNPIGYHLGTVWPHDNSLIAAGFRRCGHEEEACRILESLLFAATYFSDYRLPEAFAGCSRAEFATPVRYPVACQPQAWACGSIPFLLQSVLGLRPDGFARRLDLVRPALPDFLEWLRLLRVRVGDAEVDLRFERNGSGRIDFTIERLEGDLEVQRVET